MNEYYANKNAPVFIGAIVESFTIPMLLAAPVFLVISLVRLMKEGFSLRSTYLYSFILLLGVTIYLVVTTIAD